MDFKFAYSVTNSGIKSKNLKEHMGSLMNLRGYLCLLTGLLAPAAKGNIAATHIYHNHMPNFWPYFDVDNYDKIKDGEPIRYLYDGQVIQAKKNPPANWPRNPDNNSPLPHDDICNGYGGGRPMSRN